MKVVELRRGPGEEDRAMLQGRMDSARRLILVTWDQAGCPTLDYLDVTKGDIAYIAAILLGRAAADE